MNLCMAHRGWSGRAPENTMAAFQMAFDHPAVQAIELDVQLTKDRVPVVIHDFRVDRTTNGMGAVRDYSYAELAKLDAGSWFDPTFAGQRIPRLEEVLEAARGKCKVNIELKTAGDLYPAMERMVVELVYRLRMEREVCLTSFDHEVIRKVRKVDSRIPTGLIICGKPLFLQKQLKEAGASILSMEHSYLTRGFVQEMVKRRVTIVAWTVNKPEGIQELMKMSPFIQICTNYPNHMLDLMK